MNFVKQNRGKQSRVRVGAILNKGALEALSEGIVNVNLKEIRE